MAGAPSLAVAALIAVVLASTGCAGPSPVHAVPPVVDECGCVVPPPDVFSQMGVRAEVAQSSWDQLVFGGLRLEASPSATSLLSSAQMDARVRDYLACRAIHHPRNTPALQEHVRLLTAFMSTGPTSEEFMRWARENPPPAEPGPLPPDLTDLAGYDVVVHYAHGSAARKTRAIDVAQALEDAGFRVGDPVGYPAKAKRGEVYFGNDRLSNIEDKPRVYLSAGATRARLVLQAALSGFVVIERPQDSRQAQSLGGAIDQRIDVLTW